VAARRFSVEAGHVLAFARALGAADPPGGLFTVDSDGIEVMSGYAHARLAT
jgi:hypothetical protein